MNLRRNTADSAAFTLVELLVTVLIIAILLGLLLPAVRMVRRNAKRREAASRLQVFAQSVRTYRQTYGRWPGQTRRTADTVTTNTAPIVAALTNNPRGLLLLEIPDGAVANGPYVDPWNRPVILGMDTDGNGHVTLGLGPIGTVSNQTAVAVSRGHDPDRTQSWIPSWRQSMP